ncbi:MAG: hypothetical protein UZ17_ACD001000659 [Acidobacteria bacterium OLB17]|nr:MAG: hypothetical protein UZ17_ACD001000659 [Acidobacteria bacterium OLB17]
MTRFGRITSLFVVAICAAVIMPAVANAQLRNQNRYSKRNVSDIIKRLEDSSDKFSRDFDRALDKSNINNTPLEREYQGYVDDFEDAVDRLRENFDRSRNWWEVRSDVQDAVQKARPVNDIMVKLPFQRDVERQWRTMRNDLNKVADTYDLPGLEGGGWNGGPWSLIRATAAVGTTVGRPRGLRVGRSEPSTARAHAANGSLLRYSRTDVRHRA